MLEKVELDLSRHCVLTEIRRQQERAVALALKGRADEKVFERAEVLKEILESVDLKSLRGKYPQLQGGTEERITLVLEGEKRTLRFSDMELVL
ncbi:hypothetical protein [Desulfobotulus alkaliphilus]|nr:hypothetical protein [Desulfobotulus alkaliphilus]